MTTTVTETNQVVAFGTLAFGDIFSTPTLPAAMLVKSTLGVNYADLSTGLLGNLTDDILVTKLKSATITES